MGRDTPKVRIAGTKLFSNLVFPLARRAVNDGNIVFLRPTTNAPRKAARHPHQMRVVEIVFGPVQLSPPRAKPARRPSQPEVSVDDDAIDDQGNCMK